MLIFYICIKNSLRTASCLSLSQSRRHLFVGTSNASVAVFNKSVLCERDDIHGCNVTGADTHFCLQVTLRTPDVKQPSGSPASVTCVLCTGYNHSHTHLWAADVAGQLTVWYVPERGLLFRPARSAKVHWGAINAMESTNWHVLTASDDGYIIIHDIMSFDRVKSINIIQWGIGFNGFSLFERPDIARCIKSMTIEEDYVNGGKVTVGTSYGDVAILGLGTTI